MKVSEMFSKGALLLLVMMAIDCLPVYAQEQKTKVTIIKEYYDEDGNKVVKTIVKEGPEADAIDIDRLAEEPRNDIQWHNFNLDGINPDMQGFNFNFGESFDLRSLLDSMRLDNFNFFDPEGFGSFDNFDFEGETEFRPKLGIKISELDSQTGVLVNHVIPDSPADRAGLKEGDVILALDNEKITEPQDVIGYVKTLSAEDEVVIDILREGEHQELKATLTQFKPKKDIEIRKI